MRRGTQPGDPDDRRPGVAYFPNICFTGVHRHSNSNRRLRGPPLRRQRQLRLDGRHDGMRRPVGGGDHAVTLTLLYGPKTPTASMALAKSSS